MGRVPNRDDQNLYGRRPAEFARTLDDLAEVEPLLRASAIPEVVTPVPVEEVADAVLALVR